MCIRKGHCKSESVKTSTLKTELCLGQTGRLNFSALLTSVQVGLHLPPRTNQNELDKDGPGGLVADHGAHHWGEPVTLAIQEHPAETLLLLQVQTFSNIFLKQIAN